MLTQEEREFSPAQLEGLLNEMLEAETAAKLRGYDLMAKLYAAEWQMLYLRYVKALEKAERRWKWGAG